MVLDLGFADVATYMDTLALWPSCQSLYATNAVADLTARDSSSSHAQGAVRRWMAFVECRCLVAATEVARPTRVGGGGGGYLLEPGAACWRGRAVQRG